MEKYKGKNIKVADLNAIIVGSNVNGHSIYIAKPNGEYAPFDGTLNNCIFVQGLDDFQNAENFIKGIEYIDKYARQKSIDSMFGLLLVMVGNALQLTNSDYSTLVALFCEIGVWKNKKLVNKNIYHKDFPKYLSNVLWNYEKALNEMGFGIKAA